LRALRRGLSRSKRFALFLVACDSPTLEENLIGILTDSLPERRPIVVRLEAGSIDPLAEIERQARMPLSGPVMLVGLAAALKAEEHRSALFSALNLRRPEWPARVRQPVVFWVPSRLIGLLLRGAPDFFDWRTDTLVFQAPPNFRIEPLRSGDQPFSGDSRLTAAERRERLRELRARLALHRASEDETTLRAAASWCDELAGHLWLLGEPEEALRIRREEELPVFERLGDVRSRAITLGKIADILQARGQFDDSLRILREEVAPVYERLGDVRSTAVTLGQIADILQARGQLDEALRIRQEEELPVYERLGDVRSRLVCQANIAQALIARGQSGDRDEAGRLLAEARAAAERLRIPEAEQIRAIQERLGLDPT
jgi:tetratricopeptide (TPR) repeat protein